MRSATVRQSHPPPRPPLGESTMGIANKRVTSSLRRTSGQQSSSPLPNYETPRADVDLQTLTALPDDTALAIDSQRLSALSCGSHHDSRRDSQISSTSTNASTGGKPRKRHIGPWLLGSTLGKGANGRVRKARHAISGQEAAVKIVSRRSAVEHRSKSVIAMDKILSSSHPKANQFRVPFGIEREIVIMKLIEHPNIIKLYDVWENRGEMYIVLELVEGGELFHHIVEHGYLPEEEAVRIFRQIISGLAHCHRFRLCHRDLKPENILLDGEGNIKIVDFGMASMQPWGKWLDTSCGSPHYAPPEIAQGLRYEGDKADIWSAGVVLYVMLVGATPFGAACDTGDDERGRAGLRRILEEVIAGELIFPTDISNDAQDFIVRLLQPNPNDRLTIEQMWRHPFLKKYEDYAKHSQYARTWIGGPQPSLTAAECGFLFKDGAEIDMDIVSNLCTLWHTDDQDGLVASLLSRERNYEQVFYHRLLKSREEQEENFQGTGIEISTSDYHHVGARRVLKRSGTRGTILGAGQKRQRSQFSIVTDHAQRPGPQTHRTASEASTNQSYDPFRASRQFNNDGIGNAKITMVRGSSGTSKHTRLTSNGNSIRHPALSRLQDDARSWATTSSLPPLPRDATGRLRDLRRKALSQGYSRNSISSSVMSKTSSRASRHSVSYKRPVSFKHNRRQPVKTPSSRPSGPSPMDMQERYLRDRIVSSPQLANLEPQGGSDPNPPLPIGSRKEGVSRQPLHGPHSKEEKRFSAYLKDEARQVSQELGKFCDDAFNKSEDVTGVTGEEEKAFARESIHRQPGQFATPPPRKSSAGRVKQLVTPVDYGLGGQRPLPEPPITECLVSRKLRELAKTRDNMVQSAKILPPGTLDEAIRSIDRLIAQTCEEVAIGYERRTASAPEARERENNALSPVKEEESHHFISRDGCKEKADRHVSDPLKSTGGRHCMNKQRLPWSSGIDGIHMMNDLDALPAPLIIRKKVSGTSMNAQQVDNAAKDSSRRLGSGVGHPNAFNDVLPMLSQLRGGHDVFDGTLEPIEEDDKENHDPNTGKRASRDGKLKGWFRRSAGSQKSSEDDRGPTPPDKDARQVQSPSAVKDSYLKSRLALNDITPTSVHVDVSKKRSHQKERFLAFFSKRDLKYRKLSSMNVYDEGDTASVAPSSNAGTEPNASTLSISTVKHTRIATYPLGRQITHQPQNWLARFLHVKPARRVMAFQISKPRALREVRGILRDWKRYGMRDVMSDKDAGRLWARVDEENELLIKPVSLAIEFFTVVQRGRKANLCLARFSQEKGAKSSFERVVRTMKGVLRGRNLLIAERKKAREMRKCLVRWEGQ